MTCIGGPLPPLAAFPIDKVSTTITPCIARWPALRRRGDG